MEIKIRRIKRAWAFCETDVAHGKTQFELSIDTRIAPVPIKFWLCPNCITQIPIQINSEISRLRSEIIKEKGNVK